MTLGELLGSIVTATRYRFFNDAPVVGDRNITLVLGPADVSVPIPFNASDADGDTLKYEVVENRRTDGPQHGTVTIDQATGTFTYDPDEGYTGPDEFTVEVSDDTGGLHFHGLSSLLGFRRAHTDTATITLNVVAPNVNDAPVAVDDTEFSTAEDTDLVIQPADLLGNDTDADGDTLTIAGVGGAVGGSVVLNADNTVTFTPTPDFNGPASFTYTATDGTTPSNTATVSITVTPVNDAPVAVDDTEFSTAEDTDLVIQPADLLGNDTDADGDTLTIAGVGGAVGGSVVLNADNTVTFTPTPDFNGAAEFDYTATDGTTPSNTATVSITVTPVNDAPVAVDDTEFSTAEDTDLVIQPADLLGNDTDADGNPLTIAGVGGAVGGSVALNADGTVTFTPVADYNGPDSFTTPSPTAPHLATATVCITVTPVNDAPVAHGDSATAEDTAWDPSRPTCWRTTPTPTT